MHLYPDTICHSNGVSMSGLSPTEGLVPSSASFGGSSAPLSGESPSGMLSVESDIEIHLPDPTSSVDGIALATGDRILLTNQASSSENGEWVCAEPLIAESANP